MNFFFVTLFDNMAQGTIGSALFGVTKNIALMILAVAFLVSVYEAFLSGKGITALLAAIFKTAACGLIITNWSIAFLAVTNAFTDLGMQVINNYGNGNTSFFILAGQKFLIIFLQYLGVDQAPNPSIPPPSFTSGVVAAIVVLVYYAGMVILEFLYVAWGMIPMVMGPMMVALLPSKASAGFAREWLRNFFEWASWPFLFALLSVLAISATNGGNDLMSNNQFLTDVGLKPGVALLGSETAMIEGDLMALLYAGMMLILPFIASSLINGAFEGFSLSVIKVGQLASTGKLMYKGKYLSLKKNKARESAALRTGPLWAQIGARAAAGKPVLVKPPPSSGYVAKPKGRDSAKAYLASPQYKLLEARKETEKSFRTEFDARIEEIRKTPEFKQKEVLRAADKAFRTEWDARMAERAAGGAAAGASVAKSAMEKADLAAAKTYLKQSPTMKGIVEKFEKNNGKIRFIDSLDPKAENFDLGGTSYTPLTGTVNWDPRAAMMTSDGDSLSPSLALGHEMVHATGNKLLTSLGAGIPDRSFDNMEERRVITRYENPAAKELGEAVRSDHYGEAFRVDSPTDRTYYPGVARGSEIFPSQANSDDPDRMGFPGKQTIGEEAVSGDRELPTAGSVDVRESHDMRETPSIRVTQEPDSRSEGVKEP